MIYSKNGTDSQSKYNSRVVYYSGNVWERPEKPSDKISNDATTVIPSITEYSFGEIKPYVPVKLRRGRLRREARKIKARGKTPLWMAFLSISLIFGFCGTVLYLCFTGQYVPEKATDAVYKVFSTLYKPREVQESKQISQSFPLPASPVYLSQSPSVNSQPNSAANSSISESSSDEYENPDEVQAVSEQTGGKTGGDGKVYLPLTATDLSSGNLTRLTNQTNYKIDLSELSNKTPSAVKNLTISDEPLVLVLHTHATECYSQSDGESYDSTEPTRCDDTDKNMLRMGKEVCSVLSDFGINALQSEELHDKASFIKAYTNSKNTAKWYLEHYPSIRFILDIHRDAIIRDDGEKVKPIVNIAGESYAQIMLVAGTDQSGNKHPSWRENLCLAEKLQENFEGRYPHLCRPINLRSASFNQELSDGYLLLEVGSCGNSLDEALRSARAFGTSFAYFLRENAENTKGQ